MSTLLKQNIHTSMAKSFYSDVLSQRNMYYYFLGRTLPWGVRDVPPAIPDTYSEEALIRNHMIYMKRINPNDISFVVRRIDWVADTVFDRYDANLSETNLAASGATSIRDANFYVLTNEMNVYKCIHNNYGTPSTIKPSGTDYGAMYLDDGYIWKYLFSIPPSLQYRFLTENFIPLTQALYQRYYDNRGISSVTIKNGGSGYEGGSVTTAEVIADGAGSGAKISLSIDPSTGSIFNVRITNPGSDYIAGHINVIAVDGYGAGVYGNPEAVLIPRFKDGQLIGVTINDPGIGYSTDNQTNLVVTGSGSGAELYPVVENGSIVDVIIKKSGSAYSEVFIAVESVTGTGADISVSTGIGDIESIQADVELLAIPGTVFVVDPVNVGLNYSYANCTITGDGAGLEITPILYNGKIVRYQVDEVGSGYSWCNIVIEGDGEGATCNPLLSPYKGHGHNAIDELFASMVSFYTTIKFEQNQGMFVNNDYRQFGILKNPETIMDTSIYRELTGSSCYLLEVDSAVGITADEELYLSNDGSKKFAVVASDNEKTILIQEFGGSQISPGTVFKKASDNSFVSVRKVTKPTINKKSGELLFVDNRYSIFQTSNQYISLRTTIKF